MNQSSTDQHTNTIPLTLEQVLQLVQKGINQGQYIATIDLMVQFASAAVNEVERLMKTVISEDDLADLHSRISSHEKLIGDLVGVLMEYNDSYKGLCLIYGISPENNPVFSKAVALVNANKKEL